MYSMHHRNSAAWGRKARKERRGQTNKRGEKKNKGREMKKKRGMKERREEKKMRKERGYVGILNTLTTLQFWRLKPGQPGFRRMEREA